MGVKRLVDTYFWEDEKVMDEFSPEDKLFFLYLLTNPHSTQLGIYKILPKQIAFEIGYSIDAVKVLLDRFENKYGIIKYSPKTNEVAIKNYLRHSLLKGGKPVEDLLFKEARDVKDETLFQFIKETAETSNNATVREFWKALNVSIYNNTLYNNQNNNNSIHNHNHNHNQESYPESYDDSYHDSYHDSSQKEKEKSPSADTSSAHSGHLPLKGKADDGGETDPRYKVFRDDDAVLKRLKGQDAEFEAALARMRAQA